MGCARSEAGAGFSLSELCLGQVPAEPPAGEAVEKQEVTYKGKKDMLVLWGLRWTQDPSWKLLQL